MHEGVLFLSHCGFSFMEDLLTEVMKRGLEAYILSSQPLPEHPDRLQNIATRCTWLGTSIGHELQIADIDRSLNELHLQGKRVRCCICVWEAYRALMAHANQILGVSDISSAQVALLGNKLSLRNHLAAARLSEVNAYRLTRDNLVQLQHSGRRLFVKPIRGIASYGAFPLRPITSWRQLETIQEEASQDTVYRSAFGGEIEFMAEDYIDGLEFSFELICCAAETHIVTVHEKLTITELKNTVLEECCISPPLNLDQDALSAGHTWLRNIFSELGLAWGCYHVEARYNGIRWELIEINTRVGGSLISLSVSALNDGYSMLALWLDLMLSQNTPRQKFADILIRLPLKEVSAQKCTFFRAYFARPGKIAKVNAAELSHRPVVTQILLKTGDCIKEGSREVFLGQILWSFDLEKRDEILPTLLAESANALEVQYEELN